MTIYAFIYEGVANWSQTDAKIIVKVPGNPEIIVDMSKEAQAGTQENTGFFSKLLGSVGGSVGNFCAIAGLDFVGQESIRVTKHVTFHGGHDECDNAYNWGMQWTAGSK
jgi:tellurite resistance protein TerA